MRVAGKQKFGFDIGDQLQLKYKAAQPDKGFKKFVGLNFKCSVIRYSVQKSTNDRKGGGNGNEGTVDRRSGQL